MTMELTCQEAAINALIPLASIEAEEQAKKHDNQSEARIGKDGVLYHHHWWSLYFHRAMNRLAVKAGLRVITF